jgi:hypothetical protein
MITPMTAMEDDRLVVGPRRARYILDCSNSYLYGLLNRKELDSYLEGRNRKITVESIRRLIARRLARGNRGSPLRGRGRPGNFPRTTE